MSLSVPPNLIIPAGWPAVANDFTTWVTNPLKFLTTRVMLRAELHAATPWTAATNTLAPMDTILEDPYGGWSATATGSQAAFSWLTPAGCSGWYEISLNANTGNPTTTTDQIMGILYVNGASYQQSSSSWGVSGHNSGSSSSYQVPLTGGADYIQFYVFSTVGVNAPATAGQYPTMEAAWFSS